MYNNSTPYKLRVKNMFKVSKTRINYASKRGFDLIISEEDKELLIYSLNEDNNYLVIYNFDYNGYTFKSSCLQALDKEELCHFIFCDKKLKELIDFLYSIRSNTEAYWNQ